MLPLGLNSAELKLFNQSLSTHHSVKITVQMLSLTHAYLGDLTSGFLDGQVSIDADAEVTRSLTLQLNDPDHTLQLDSSAPTDGALFYDRMVRVVYSVKSELLPRWVDVPVFCGPITKMSRTADVINLEAQGKEALLLPPAVAWQSRTFGKGWPRSALVKEILRTYGGETKFSIPEFTWQTPGPVSMTSETNLWALAKSVNGSFATRFIFYDGRGCLVMRNAPRSPVWTFRTGTGGNVTTDPQIDYDLSAARNVVRVKGAIPKGKKTPLYASVGLPSSHPLNHNRMGRNGVARVLLEVVTDDNIKTVSQARTLAKARVNALAREAVDIQFSALVVPHLEPNDIYTISTSDVSINARYARATIPLKSAVGTVGYLTNRSINKARIRRK